LSSIGSVSRCRTSYTLFAITNQVSSEYDRALLRVGRIHYGQSILTNLGRSTLRSTFVRMVLA
jgi:hypothetical protein